MKKTILALLLALAMIVCFGAFTVSAAEETAHEHCVCNGTVSGNDAHTCESVTWTPISGALTEAGLTTETADFGKLPSGNYYLDTDIVVTGVSTIGTKTAVKNTAGTTINNTYTSKSLAIDLNGHNVTTTVGRVFGGLYYGSKLVITDCVGTGTITGGNGTTGTVIYTYAGSTFEIYGGNIVSAEGVTTSYGLFCIACDSYFDANGDGKLTAAGDQQHADNRTFFNMYGGNLVGGHAGNSGGTFVAWHNAQVAIYGGTITGGSSAKTGGNINVGGAGSTLSIYGGTISGGEAVQSGGNIYIGAGKLFIYGGTISGGTSTEWTGGNIAAGVATTITGGTITGGSAATYGNDISWLDNDSSTITLDGTFGTLDMGGYGKGGLALTENFSAEKITVSSSANYGIIVKSFANEAQLACIEAKVEGEEFKTINGKVYLYKGEDGKHYACNCGGAYTIYTSRVGHTACAIRSDWQDLAAFLADKNIAEGEKYTLPAGRYYLSADLAINHYLVVAKDSAGNGTVVSIDLNGYTLTTTAVTGGTDIPLLRVNGACELNITDSSFDAATGTFSGKVEVSGSDDYPLMYVNGTGLCRIYGGNLVYAGEKHGSGLICTSGEIRMFAGYINGGKSTTNGASMCIYDSGKFIMYGGTVTGGEATTNGGNIFLHKNGCQFSIYDGTVSGGTGVKGGNIYATRGTVTVNGGIITGGYATERGGNIYIHGGYDIKTDSTTGAKSFEVWEAKLNVKGGEITNGTAGKLDADGKPTSGSGGNVTIFGQTATTSYTIDEVKTSVFGSFGGTMTMTAGTISGGKAYTAGNVDAFGTMTMDGGLITDGYAVGEAGNLRVYYIKDYDADGNEIAASSFTMNGGEITKGTADANGGGVLTYTDTYLNGGKITDSTSGKMGGNLRPFRPANVTIGEQFVISGGKAVSGGGNIAIGGTFSDAAGAWPAYSYMTLKGTVTGGTSEYNAGSIYASDYTVVTIDGANVKGEGGDFDIYLTGNAEMTIAGAAQVGTVFQNNRALDNQPVLDLTGLTAPITLDAFALGQVAVAGDDVSANVTAVPGKTIAYTAGTEDQKGVFTMDTTEVININAASELTSITVGQYEAVYYAINSQLNGMYVYINGESGVSVILNGEVLTKTDGVYVAELTGAPTNQLIVSSTAVDPVTMVAEINYLKGTEQNPIVIDDASELTSVEAPAGGETYYAINSMLNGMTLTIAGNENTTVTLNGVALAADANGLITVTLTGAPTNRLVVANAGTEAVELVAALEWPVGSEQNPIVINNASELTTVEAGKYYAIAATLNTKYLVIEEAAGTVTLNGETLTAENGYFVAELTGAPVNKLTVTATAAAEIVDEAPVLIEKFDIDVARMILGNALEFQFGLKTTKVPDTTGYYAVIEKSWADGTTTTKEIHASEWGVMGAYYAIVYDGLAAKEMGDTFTVTIYNAKGQAVSNAKEDSVRAYVARAYAGQSAKGKTMMVDMLNYGAAAQVHFNYGTDDLANSKLTDAQKAVATATAPEMSNDQVKGANYQGTRFLLTSAIQVQLAFKNMTSDMYAIYTYQKADGTAKEVRVEGTDFVIIGGKPAGVELSALVYSDARALVNVTLYKADGTVYGTASDSIESCALRSNADVFVALMKFADSAKASLYG